MPQRSSLAVWDHQPNWDVPTDTALQLTNGTVSPLEIGYWPFAATAYVAAGDPATDETAATSLQAAVDAAGEVWPWNTGVAGQLVDRARRGRTDLSVTVSTVKSLC